jgi:PAS domain-containing protein
VFYLPDSVASGHPDEELRIVATTGRYSEEGWRVRKDGSHFLAEVVLTAIHNKTGALSGFAKITRDITAKKRVEKNSERSRRRLDLILSSSIDGIIVLEVIRDEIGVVPDLRFEMINPAAAKLIGRKASNCWGTPRWKNCRPP